MTRDLPIELVHPNPDQPRKFFDAKKLEELAASISSKGQLQAIRVRSVPDGTFEIVLGERRWRAHKLLGRATIRAEIVDMADDERDDQAITENLQRADVTPLEEARAFQRRLDTGLSVEELAKRLGLKQAWRITERTNLLKLRGEFQDALERGILSPSQAQEMSRLPAHTQPALFSAIREGRCRTYEELRRVTSAMLAAEAQTGMFANAPAPTKAEREIVRRLEGKIDKVCELLAAGFDGNEVVVLQKVNPGNAEVLAQKLELIEKSLKEMRLALHAAAAASKTRAA